MSLWHEKRDLLKKSRPENVIWDGNDPAADLRDDGREPDTNLALNPNNRKKWTYASCDRLIFVTTCI